MGSRTQDLPCRHCQAITPHEVSTPNHVLHLLLTLFSVGLWLPVWILVTLFAGRGDATCLKCVIALAQYDREHPGERQAAVRSEDMRALMIVGGVAAAIALVVTVIRLID